MLDITLKNSYQDSDGYNWEYYRDDTDHNIFYIVPRPRLVLDANGLSAFQVVRYSTQNPTPGHAGHCCFGVELSVSPQIQ